MEHEESQMPQSNRSWNPLSVHHLLQLFPILYNNLQSIQKRPLVCSSSSSIVPYSIKQSSIHTKEREMAQLLYSKNFLEFRAFFSHKPPLSKHHHQNHQPLWNHRPKPQSSNPVLHSNLRT
jgi:hypothetical protein